MLISIDPTATQEYTLKADIGETKTIWVLGLFDSYVAAKLQSMLYSKSKELESTTSSDITDFVFDIVKFGLKDVRNFNIPFSTESIDIPKVGKRTVVSSDFMQRLKVEWIVELYNELLKINFLQESDSKN